MCVVHLCQVWLCTHMHKDCGPVRHLHQGSRAMVQSSHLTALHHLTHPLTRDVIQHSATWWQEMLAQGQTHVPRGRIHIQNPRQDLRQSQKKRTSLLTENQGYFTRFLQVLILF